MATIKDVARESGYTVTTVSRMLNNRGYISDEAKRKITEAMERLDYFPNELSRGLSGKQNNLIGLIVPNLDNPYFTQIVSGIEATASAKGFKLLICCSRLDPKKERDFLRVMNANKAAGIILASSTPYFEKHIPQQMRIVSIGRKGTQEIPSVGSDNYLGGKLVAEHLLRQGCRQLAYINGSVRLPITENPRYLGFAEVCRANSVPVTVTEISEADLQSEDYIAICSCLLDEHPELDGIFASNDIIGAQFLQTCSTKGISVPKDIKVVGYDDVYFARMCIPPLTTVRQPISHICKMTVDLLLSDASGSEPLIMPNDVVYPVQLIVRGSTQV